MKNWKILDKNSCRGKKAEEIVEILFKNRGLKTKKEIEEFLNPKLESVTPKNVGINLKHLNKALSRIKKAIKNNEQIVVFGDYDVDGICGTAIIWETLISMKARAVPYIPHRIGEGYGLSIKGIESVRQKIPNCSLIITVDNGIVANNAVNFANKLGIDVIITDHHTLPRRPEKIPNAFAIVHTVQLCGAGVAHLLSEKLGNLKNNHLELVALATVADMVPLKGANRTLLKFGIKELKNTKRIGLLELFKEAKIEKESINVYSIGHIIAPRINAMGRLEYAMDSLELICTADSEKAIGLAHLLGETNRARQDLTSQMVLHAKESIDKKTKLKNLLFISHESYEQGVIGLVAGKIVEEFYRPAIVVSIGEKYSKASARSVSGFNIIEFIRGQSSLLVDAGGHPMAAGFTIETEKLSLLQRALEKSAETLLNKELLTRSIKIDCELSFSVINIGFYEEIQKLEPFGVANPQPVFMSEKVLVRDMRLVGRDGTHLKLKLSQDGSFFFDGIGFGLGENIKKISIGDEINIVYAIDKDTWNGDSKLQLKIKDLKKN